MAARYISRSCCAVFIFFRFSGCDLIWTLCLMRLGGSFPRTIIGLRTGSSWPPRRHQTVSALGRTLYGGSEVKRHAHLLQHDVERRVAVEPLDLAIPHVEETPSSVVGSWMAASLCAFIVLLISV